jgi:Dyp-type peroxidase family
MHAAEPPLRADQIQGNVIPGFNTDHQRLVGFAIHDVARARAWLADQARGVTTLAEVHAWRRGPKREGTWRNLCFSYAALERIGGPDFRCDAIRDPWFKRGAAKVGRSLGDRDAHAWPRADVLAILGDNDPRGLGRACADLIREAERHGLGKAYEESGTRRKESREPFGFRDGVSVPTVRGTVDGRVLARRRPAGALLADRLTATGKPLLWPGQAVFGYPGQSRVSAVAPGETASGGRSWMVDGSFLVYRKLRQDVDAFRAFAERAAHDLGTQREHVEAMLIGRWHDGSPVVRHPNAPGGYDAGANDFRYFADTPAHVLHGPGGVPIVVPPTPADPHGERCPHLAHIRKVNPRDAPSDLAGEPMALALQPFRRGIPYADPDGQGLLFLAYTTAIEERFGALVRGWVGLDLAPEAPSRTADAIAGGGDRPFVEAVGGGFFFAPSRDTLAALTRSR